MNEYLARIDVGLERICRRSARANGHPVGRPLTRDSFQALFLRGMLGDLPLENQMHAGMQERIWRAMPLFDEVATGVSRELDSSSPPELGELQAALRQPEAKERLISTLDSEAALTGVSAPRRAQTRQLLEHVTWRLASQPPSLIVGEYLEKIEKVAAADVVSEARRQRLAARLGEKTFWGVARQDWPVVSGSMPRRAGARTFGIDVVHRSSGVAVAASAEDVVIATVVVGATVGVVVLLVYLVKALVNLGRDETEGTIKTDPTDPETTAAEP
jgi:hypothetical protein